MLAVSLPEGMTSRSLEPTDAPAVHAVIAAQELADVGTVGVDVADLVADWQRPSYDLAASSVAVLEAGRMVAYAEHLGADRYDAAVHPDVRGRGIGTWLAAWAQECARSRGATELGMPVPAGSPGDRLLTALGYRVRWTSWVLRLPAGRRIAERPLPEGYAVRPAAPEDREQVWQVLEDAFLEWSDRARTPYDDFAAAVWQRPGFEPWHLPLVVAPDGDVAGVAFLTTAPAAGEDREVEVERLAVHPAHRGRGLAQSLLLAAYAAGASHGAEGLTLATDSRTGALALYEKVGMVVASTWVNRAIAL
ncbi:GNAT family N-acetyltransferase [Nocardioides ultimimeridianus]